MLDELLLLGLLVVGTGALWLIAMALFIGSRLLEQFLEWLVFGRRLE